MSSVYIFPYYIIQLFTLGTGGFSWEYRLLKAKVQIFAVLCALPSLLNENSDGLNFSPAAEIWGIFSFSHEIN